MANSARVVTGFNGSHYSTGHPEIWKWELVFAGIRVVRAGLKAAPFVLAGDLLIRNLFPELGAEEGEIQRFERRRREAAVEAAPVDPNDAAIEMPPMWRRDP